MTMQAFSSELKQNVQLYDLWNGAHSKRRFPEGFRKRMLCE